MCMCLRIRLLFVLMKSVANTRTHSEFVHKLGESSGKDLVIRTNCGLHNANVRGILNCLNL